ncbi:hypothetical protein AMTR_s00024p00155680 [Amborella trichopoda]|uniref:Cyclic nucleotide-binding domain-containing protein n=2 Tax=Amborella trichopoda TaxID=13333 RepID=W1PM60_AMBTC|nr:hypothetical protein AMTR_s00024p00155680 [Amborella trichopoda]
MLDTRIEVLNDGGFDRERKRFSLSRCVSFSVDATPTPNSNEYVPMFHTGPLRSSRKNPYLRSRDLIHTLRDNEGSQGTSRSNAVQAIEFPNDNGKTQESDKEKLDNSYDGKNEHLLRSGPLGRCNDPFCTTCPSYYNIKATTQRWPYSSSKFELKFDSALYGDAKGWIRRSFSDLSSKIPGVMNPHSKFVQQWNKFFVVCCFIAIFVDPLFFVLLWVQKDYNCMVLDWSLATAIAVVRSFTDFSYFLHMLLQFRVAYVAPESRIIGTGDLVDHPKKIVLHYLRGKFLIDLFVVLPLPQIMILVVLPKYIGSSAANYAKNLLRATVLLQYIPRMCRFLPLLVGRSETGFIFESAWANFVINLLIFVLAGHVVGSCWYLLGLQRVNVCLRDACWKFINTSACFEFLDCGHGSYLEKFKESSLWDSWKNNSVAAQCYDAKNGPFPYGIYGTAVPVTIESRIISRYIYSLFWGFQQISTLAGNQVPSVFPWEVLFTMGIIGLGLFLFALLIGNMQNFLQSLGRRRLEMQLQRRDVEQWMSYRRLPEDLRRRVRQSERFNWAATRGVKEDHLLENLPEDLQRDIRRHLFEVIQKVRIFSAMDETTLDIICERLRQKLYIEGCEIQSDGGPIEKMVFIVRGKMESTGADGYVTALAEGDVVGEELLTWWLEQSPSSKDKQKMRLMEHVLISRRKVKCISNVIAFVLRGSDLEEVPFLFMRFLRNPEVIRIIRCQSPYWRALAATRIQVAWRYRKKWLNRGASKPTEIQ